MKKLEFLHVSCQPNSSGKIESSYLYFSVGIKIKTMRNVWKSTFVLYSFSLHNPGNICMCFFKVPVLYKYPFLWGERFHISSHPIVLHDNMKTYTVNTTIEWYSLFVYIIWQHGWSVLIIIRPLSKYKSTDEQLH